MSGIASKYLSPVARGVTANAASKSTTARKSSQTPKYLAQRNGVYYFKRKVPSALVPAFGNRNQVWKSLETADFSEACRRLPKEIAAFELQLATFRHQAFESGMVLPNVELCDAGRGVRFTDLTADMIPSVLQRYYVHMLQADDEELRAMRPLRMADLVERRAQIDEALDYFRLALVSEDTSVVAETVDQLLTGEHLTARRNSAVRNQLCRELLQLEMKILQEQRARLDGNRQLTPEVPVAIRLQPSLLDYLQTWLRAKQRPLRTVSAAEKTVHRWMEYMGDGPATSIKRADVKAFRDFLLEMNLASNTIRNRLGLLRAIVACYHDEHDIEGISNPFDNIRVEDRGQRQRTKKERRAFEISELNRMYRTAVFTEKQFPRGQIGPAAYWIPLMGPYVGARIEELAQLKLNDIEIINGVWTIRICQYDSENQSLKTDSSFRRVPIHEELVKLGFLRYLCEQKRKGETRVFSTLRADNKHRLWSNSLGKWFGRFLDTCRLSSPNLDYHSFRYTFKQRLTQCGVNLEVRDALCGHWADKDSAGKVYLRRTHGQYDFQLLCEGMHRLRYAELDLSHLYVQDPYKDVDVRLFVQ